MVELMVEWYSFLWGNGRKNPVLDSLGIPTTVMLDTLFANMDWELSAGQSTRASCPETVWQSCKWWHRYDREAGGREGFCPKGRYFVRHKLVE